MKHDDTGLAQVGFTLDTVHCDDVAWVGKLPKIRFRVVSHGDRSIAQLAVMLFVGRYGRHRNRQGPGIAKAKPNDHG